MAPLIGQFSTLEAAEATFGAPGWTAVLADTMVYGYNVPENAVWASPPRSPTDSDRLVTLAIAGLLVGTAALYSTKHAK